MIEKNKETNKYHAVCDCCFEYSDEYDSFNEVSTASNTTAGNGTMTRKRENGSISAQVARRIENNEGM